MRKLHPLRLLAGDGNSFLFLFRSADGDKEFSFTVNTGSFRTIGGVSNEFYELTDGDMAIRCIIASIGYFDSSKLMGGTKFGSLSEECQPIAIEYKGECRDGAFKYLVSLSDTACSVHTEDVVVSYKDPENVLLWSGGHCLFGFDPMAMLEVKEPKPEFSDLLNAILQFDQSRYVPSYPDEEPMKIEQ